MSDISIIFSAPMITALRSGRKTMTRRLASRIKIVTNPKNGHHVRNEIAPTTWRNVRSGDRLWVRENLGFEFNSMRPTYVAGSELTFVPNAPQEFCGPCAKYPKSRPSIYMPRWASRLTLTVIAVKIERLQDIREADCIAEGAEIVGLHGNPVDDGPMVRLKDHVYGTPRTWFRELWERLHGVGAWDANPEVVALTFTVQERNVDEAST